MKAARINAYNAIPVVEDAPVPEIGPDDVLIQVAAASLNPLDTKIQQGAAHDFFPVKFAYTLGTDLAGTIIEVGENVMAWEVGDRVVARTDPPRGGAFGEQALVPATHLARLPEGFSIKQAAGVPTTAGTAWQALFEVSDLQAGQTVLIHAGAGGVGSFALQMALNAGARVIATASGDGLDIVRKLGADQVIDYRAQQFETAVANVDLVLDTIGGETQARSFAVLRRGGRLASTVQPPDETTAKAHEVTANFVFHQSNAARLKHVLGLVASGTLKLLVDRTVPLDAFPEAFAYQISGRARGKIIVDLEK
jgi:NADPH:quinone reductase-like Zn-dependent oxidoreductase